MRFLGRIILGTISDHARIGRALEMPLQLFSVNFSKIRECNFAWQAQHLVKFMCHFLWQVQHLVKVHVSLFAAGAACGEIWNDSRSGKRCNFQ